jgi:hypothetical protein
LSHAPHNIHLHRSQSARKCSTGSSAAELDVEEAWGVDAKEADAALRGPDGSWLQTQVRFFRRQKTFSM